MLPVYSQASSLHKGTTYFSGSFLLPPSLSPGQPLICRFVYPGHFMRMQACNMWKFLFFKLLYL